MASDRVFVSYSLGSGDPTPGRARIQELVTSLRRKGLDVLWDDADLERTLPVHEGIFETLRGCDGLVLLATPEALASTWCILEVGAAKARDKPVVVVLADGATRRDLPAPLADYPTCTTFDQAADDIQAQIAVAAAAVIEGDVAHGLHQSTRTVWLVVGTAWREDTHFEPLHLLAETLEQLAAHYRVPLGLTVVSTTQAHPVGPEQALDVVRAALDSGTLTPTSQVMPWHKFVDRPGRPDAIVSVACTHGEHVSLEHVERRQGTPWIWLSHPPDWKASAGPLSPTAAALSEWMFLALHRLRDRDVARYSIRGRRLMFRVLRSALLADVRPVDIPRARHVMRDLRSTLGWRTVFAYPLRHWILGVVLVALVLLLGVGSVYATRTPTATIAFNLTPEAARAFVTPHPPNELEGDWHATYLDNHGRRSTSPDGTPLPPEPVSVSVTDASVFTTHEDRSTGLTYWGQGRVSAEGVLTLSYWSALHATRRDAQNLVGSILLRRGVPAGDLELVRCGRWAGRVRGGDLARGLVVWSREPLTDGRISAVMDACDFSLEPTGELVYVRAIKAANEAARQRDKRDVVLGEIKRPFQQRHPPGDAANLEPYNVAVYHYVATECPMLDLTRRLELGGEPTIEQFPFPCNGEANEGSIANCAYYSDGAVSRWTAEDAREDPGVIAARFDATEMCRWRVAEPRGSNLPAVDAACASFGLAHSPDSGVLCVSTTVPGVRFGELDRETVAGMARSLEPWLIELREGHGANPDQAGR